MPTISKFYGLVIMMYFNDHDKPHVHVKYGNKESVFDIETGELTLGQMPNKGRQLVKEWLSIHKSELLTMWKTKQIKKLPRLE